MIQKIKLKNFQSLKDVTFNLGRVTVLRGKSDVGKSAVIRGLNAFFNNSFNQEYAHNGELPFGVAIQKDNKVAIGRRTAKGVEYKFDSTLYSKTAKKIPSDISNFLGIYPYAIDVDMSVFFQIQKQFDTPFLLTDSSITVAKIIGRVSNLNIVLMAMREMYASQLETKQEVNYLYSRKKEIKNSLLRFSNFDDYEANFKLAEDLEDEINALSSSKQKLYELITMGDNYNKRVKSFKDAEKEIEKVNSLLSFLLVFETVHQTYSNYLNVNSALNNLNSKGYDESCSLVDYLIEQQVKFSVLSGVSESLSNILNKTVAHPEIFNVLEDIDLDKLGKIQEAIDQGKSFNERVRKYKEAAADFKALEEEYTSLYNSFTEGKVICPFSKLEMQDFCKKNLVQ